MLVGVAEGPKGVLVAVLVAVGVLVGVLVLVGKTGVLEGVKDGALVNVAVGGAGVRVGFGVKVGTSAPGVLV